MLVNESLPFDRHHTALKMEGGDPGFVAAGTAAVGANTPSEAQTMLTTFWSRMGEEIRTMHPVRIASLSYYSADANYNHTMSIKRWICATLLKPS